MSQRKTNRVDRLHQRQWIFANCVFDESNWSLTVAGRRVAVEVKPLVLLRALLLQAGKVISKEDLLNAVWPDVKVVEASLTTAVRKLRRALGDDHRKVPIIETASRIGYRLAVRVNVKEAPASEPQPAVLSQVRPPFEEAPAPAPLIVAAERAQPSRMIVLTALGGVAVGVAAAATAFGLMATQEPRPQMYSQSDAAIALRKLDIGAVERMIASGWDPSAAWDKEGNDALSVLLNRCEWDPAHDRRQMLMMARTLIEGGAPIDRRNVWGDTAYSIAKAPRYCGPDHPVTQMLEAMCYGGNMGPKDLCLATYELTARQRRAQGLPPKAQHSRERRS